MSLRQHIFNLLKNCEETRKKGDKTRVLRRRWAILPAPAGRTHHAARASLSTNQAAWSRVGRESLNSPGEACRDCWKAAVGLNDRNS